MTLAWIALVSTPTSAGRSTNLKMAIRTGVPKKKVTTSAWHAVGLGLGYDCGEETGLQHRTCMNVEREPGNPGG